MPRHIQQVQFKSSLIGHFVSFGGIGPTSDGVSARQKTGAPAVPLMVTRAISCVAPSHRVRQSWTVLLSLAGFQVIIDGRIWVVTDGNAVVVLAS
jgi:hypothetical protein